MKCKLTKDGYFEITPETEVEYYALECFLNQKLEDLVSSLILLEIPESKEK